MSHRPIERLQRELGDGVVDQLTELSGSDLTSLLLEVMHRRAARASPSDVLRRYRSDRFVGPGVAELRELHRVESILLDRLPTEYAGVVLAPLAPNGTHSVMAAVHQNKVVSTVRSSDVAADPTAGLALEAAVRRRSLLGAAPKDSSVVRLASLQRVTRAQAVEGPVSFAHFTLLGLVSAGRDRGGLVFERESVAEHATYMASALAATGADSVRLAISDWTGRLDGLLEEVAASVAELPVTVVADAERVRARGYYVDAAIEAWVTFGDNELSVGDGGLVDWSQALVGSAKERMMISGIGVDRLAIGLG